MLAFYSKFLFLFLLGFIAAGCSLGYIAEQSQGQYNLLYKKRDFEKVLQDPQFDPETKRKIRLVIEVKDFSETVLKLKPSKNYKGFVQLDDKYVTYVVTASPKNKIDAYIWSFPIIGKVPYKGFFKKNKAEVEAKNLRDKNYDVLLRGISAYSTLGWFSDPLLSSMTNMSDIDLVETVIHELTHGTYFKNNDTDFNERLATFVGEKGVELFYKSKEGDQSETVKKIILQKKDSLLFHNFMKQEILKIEDFYKNSDQSTNLENLRELQFEQLKTRFKTKIIPQLKTEIYKNFGDSKINNAVLLNYRLYYDDLNHFESLFNKANHDWDLFFKNLSATSF